MLAKKPKKCAQRMSEALDRFHGSRMPAEQVARRRLILLCSICGKCSSSPALITGEPQQTKQPEYPSPLPA